MTSKKAMKPIFGYWNIRGFGQPVRYILKYLKIEYDERIYNCTTEIKFDEWNQEKANLGLDFPNLPYWIDGDIKITEARAIIKHLARENEPQLLPQDPETQRRAEMLEGVVIDVWDLLVNATYINTEGTLDEYERQVPAKLEQISKFIGSNEWSLGKNLSYLDFIFYEVLHHSQVFKPDILQNHHVLQKFMERFENLPQIAEFMRSSTFLRAPCFRPWAKHQI